MSRLVRRHILVVLMVVLAAISVAAGAGQSARELFERARLLEKIDPESAEVMKLYERAAANANKDRALAAQALLGLARAQERAGKPEAQTTYQRIVDEFASQPGVIVDARARLAALQPQTAGRRPLDPVDVDSRLGIYWVPSPDGRFAIDNPGGSSDPGLVLHDLVKDTHQVIVRNESAQARVRGTGVWSPDGRKIAFLWGWTGLPPTGRAQSIEIRIVDIASGESRMLTAKPNVSPPRAMTIRGWTTRDEVVFTLGQQDVFFIAATDGTATTVTLSESSQFGDVVPDGSALVVTGPERMSRFDRTSGKEDVLTRGFEVRSPRVSADGKLIAYFAKQSANWSLRVAPMTGSAIDRSIQIAEVPVPVDEMFIRLLRWGPEGRLTFDAQVAGDSLYGLRLTGGRARPDAKVERLVHDSWSAGNPVISPDGRLIAYSASQGLAVMNADGSSERLLVEGGFPVGWMSSDEVVFNGSIDEGVFAVSVKTGTVRSIGYDAPVNANAGTGAPQQDAFQYAGLRNEIVFRRFTNDHARFFVRQPGGEERQVLEFAIARPGPLPAWRISPGGDRLAYVPRRAGPDAPLVLRVRNLSNDTDKVAGQIGRFPDSITWTPDGKRLVFNAATSGGAFEVRQYDVDTGETEIVLDSRHVSGIFPPEVRWDVLRCSLPSDRSFVVCAADASTTHRFAWGGVTMESVMARLGQR